MNEALNTIRRYSDLLHLSRSEPALAQVNPESVGTEALALMSYFGRRPATTHVLNDEGLQFPVAVVDEVFREATSSRAKLNEIRQEQAGNKRKLHALIIAQWILSLVAVGAAGAVLYLTGLTGISWLWAALTFLVLATILGALELSASWTAWVFKGIASGPTGIVSAIGDRVFGTDDGS
jgi:hypothetical protein